MARKDWKIFNTNRIGLSQLYEDAERYIKGVYNANEKEFTTASPFAQLLSVIIHLGRMILFYIETSITEMNIETAYQARSVRGLAQLTGHVPSRGMAARGTLNMTYNHTAENAGETIILRNYTKIVNTANGLTYLAVFSSPTLQLTIGANDSKIEIPIIQGNIKYQQGTGTGEALQSFNFANKVDNIVDDFFVNVYVNGKRWEAVESILDMTYEQEACIIKTSMNGGIDVFFGTGNNGKIPVKGATILCEYIVSAGEAGNVDNEEYENYWKFSDPGYDLNGDQIDLNEIYNLSSASDILFGCAGEDINMTRKLAPHASRSFVLANSTNYKTFLSKLNIFSVIDVFSGFNSSEDKRTEDEYNAAMSAYVSAKERYTNQVKLTGEDSEAARILLADMNEKKSALTSAKIRYDESTLDDNVIYLYLVPDIKKRIGESETYFNCAESRFKLTDDEKTAVLDLIDNSGAKVLTIENRIIDPIYARFAINIFVQIYSDYEFNTVKSYIISEISEYLMTSTRRERYPISDIIKIVEAVPGVDSVTAYFDADKENEKIFGEGKYGIDEYGDIYLTRSVSDKFGNLLEINNIQPLFRGNFTSFRNISYEDSLDGLIGPVNITLRGKTRK